MNSDPVSTGCDALDELLGGGIEREAVTQVYGQPAAGKTNIALSTAITNAATGDKTIYIDTEGISADRFEQIAKQQATGDVDEIASNVIIKEATTFEEQHGAIQEVEEIVSQASLIVVDSATGFYRLQRDKEAEEGESLREIANQIVHLLGLARKQNTAVLITNQVFTDPEKEQVRPLGGHTLKHWTATVLRVDRFRGGNRRATLEKHRSQPAGKSVTFQITKKGIQSGDTPSR
ncbi:DNA repair and recombination protein RadB [Salinarchaeum sp. IM2453]|uniref:DNA repair and recombination protein RadB n=1 Tax=Salinarchaeum sp. IM2453 TaxID=2862870 RepID=UPI001C829388|nr:DNA repair and recombination protein RadB [Salinarchaeum sp. IM2453]QZA88823.1 DNA repair and recombination protein RadB [Salinarchaeum sp. IM2453]